MDTTIDISQAKLYVGTYRKYNNGSLDGKWFDLSDFENKDEFISACLKYHKDEHDPELMFQDSENIPECLFDESWLSTNFFTVRAALENLDADRHEPFYLWCDNDHKDLSKDDIDDLVRSFEEDYQGCYKSEEDFAWEFVSNNHELSDFSRMYFDYEKYAAELFCGSYWYSGGHVFHHS